jgi:2-oxoglutarate dehydrogenase E1 component
VVEGFTRAAQEDRNRPGPPAQNPDRALAVTIHGDAAFPGEGVVAETLNLSRLPGYQTGGSLRIIANNQLGYTTSPLDGRSTLYASDLAKGYEIPIVHVNADDPEACVAVVRLAHAYRERFKKDFLIDLVGYRRWGHNEGDEPAFTQPTLYAQISTQPTARQIYADRLIAEGVISAEEVEAMRQRKRQRLQRARDSMSSAGIVETFQGPEEEPQADFEDPPISEDTLKELNGALLALPEGFALNPKLERAMSRRRTGVETDHGIDWAHAESLAFASILAAGTPIRMSGQDTERGTFSQRHLVLHDPKTDAAYIPLQQIPQARASFAVYNSPLSESAVMGFEYGYSVHAPDAMVLWEAQFGDFANVGQVLIDQFITSARAKWRQCSSLVLLLPHGYEGQGPEHSSARLERYLQLAAEDNLHICYCTTAAQYFHLLRAQAASLNGRQRPLVVMTPKSLLRNPRAASSLRDLAHGTFQPVLEDAEAASRRKSVERLLLCSGKIAVDLAAAETDETNGSQRLAVGRLEQLYPFPAEMVERIIGSYPNLREVMWVQEEPQNMGAWSYVAPRLRPLLPQAVPLLYVGRPERASTAEGSGDAHAVEQDRILREARASETRAKIETHGGHDAG